MVLAGSRLRYAHSRRGRRVGGGEPAGLSRPGSGPCANRSGPDRARWVRVSSSCVWWVWPRCSGGRQPALRRRSRRRACAASASCSPSRSRPASRPIAAWWPGYARAARCPARPSRCWSTGPPTITTSGTPRTARIATRTCGRRPRPATPRSTSTGSATVRAAACGATRSISRSAPSRCTRSSRRCAPARSRPGHSAPSRPTRSCWPASRPAAPWPGWRPASTATSTGPRALHAVGQPRRGTGRGWRSWLGAPSSRPTGSSTDGHVVSERLTVGWPLGPASATGRTRPGRPSGRR